MDLKITWWNCHLSAPATRAKPRQITNEFLAVVLGLLDDGTDMLCLCEVSDDNCRDLAAHIGAAAALDSRYAAFTVKSFYSKSGNKIDDYGVIFRSDKLAQISAVVDLNSVAEVSDKYLKVGKKVRFKLYGSIDIYVILCHWQSLRNYSEDSHVRTEIAVSLRGNVRDIYDEDPNALIAICGDFNDEPFSRSIQMALKASRDISYVKARSDALFNPFWKLIGITDLVSGVHLPAGTCSTLDSQYMTNWRTFDQIILSSGFLRNGWSFVGSGVEIITFPGMFDDGVGWSDLSDHYPISCSLKRAVL